MDTINLYTMPGCPKCEILKKKCSNNNYILVNDFKICEVNPNDKNDAYLMFLQEHGIENMPILLVNDKIFNFGEAIKFLEAAAAEVL